MADRLLDAKDYQLIAELSLAAKRRVTGLVTGEQRSPVQGGGIEFADYREYQPGDDVRRIDWSVFLRLRRLLVRVCAEEKELTLMLILDNSRSMRFGEPDKLWVAARLAAVLAGIALHGGNRAGVATLGGHLRELLRPERSRASLIAVLDAISRLEPAEAVDLLTCTREFAARYGRKTMVVFVSDLLYPEWPQVLGGLAASGCEGYVVQLLAPEELDPPFLGKVTLVDVEGLGETSLHIGQGVMQQYRRELAVFLREVRRTCHRQGLWHAMVPSDRPLDRVLHSTLRQGGPVC